MQEEQKHFVNEHVSYFFTHVMSVDETRISVLMISFIFSLGFSAYMYAMTGEINHAWVDIVETIVMCISAINVATSITCNKNISSNGTTNTLNNNFTPTTNYRNYNNK